MPDPRSAAAQVPAPLTPPAALALHGISHRFGHVTALDDATLDVRAGTVHALLGENGAGKTTLMRVAFGLVHPDAGTIRVNGHAQRFASPSAALAAGVGMVHQHFTLVPAMTVAENVALGGRGRFVAREWNERVREIGERTGLPLDPQARVSELSIGAQQRCEIIKALARNVRILLLDEPTAVLAPDEARDVLGWVREFANAGHAVVLITHKLRDALAVADDITVLRRGRTVLTAPVAGIGEGELSAAMLGAESAAAHALRETPAPPVTSLPAAVRSAERDGQRAERDIVIDARDVSVRDAAGVLRLEGASLAVRKGELVGIAGVEGAGQRELLRVLAGRLVPTQGTVTLPSRVGFVPEDRHGDALLLDATVVENIALGNAGARVGRMPWTALREATRSIVSHYQVRTGGEDVPVRTLSGGNQQRLIIGRELSDAPGALIAENPTRGLDFRAAVAVHAALREARAAGTAIVVYSNDLDEVLALADRVLVVHAGHVREVDGDRQRVGRAMLGA